MFCHHSLLAVAGVGAVVEASPVPRDPTHWGLRRAGNSQPNGGEVKTMKVNWGCEEQREGSGGIQCRKN